MSAKDIEPLSLFPPEVPLVSEQSHDSFHGLRNTPDPRRETPDPRREASVQASRDIVRDFTKTIDDRIAALKHLAEEVTLRATALEAQNQTIEHGLVKASQAVELVTTWETRLASLTKDDQLFRRSEQIVAELEQRAARATADLERRAGDFETRKQIIEQAEAQLQQRAAGTAADIEQRLGLLDAQKRAIDQAFAEATAVTDRLLKLQPRIAQLTSQDQELGRTEKVVAQLERRAADANEGVELRLRDFDARKEAIERARTEATRVTDVLSQSLPRRRALIGGIGGAVLLVVVGLVAVDRPDHSAGALSATLPQRDRAATAPLLVLLCQVLISTSLSFSIHLK